jgi:hypothetical protein
VALPLVAKGPREAVFEGPEHGVSGSVRLSYRRDGDSLAAVLEKEGGKQEFRFQRR